MKKKESVILNVLPYILIIVGECIFFHSVLLNDRLLAGPTDGRLNMFFMEHWYKVFKGQEVWTEQGCFYPATRVLSYSDIMLGFGLPYSLLRLIGVSRYMACKWVLIITHVIGSLAMYRFLRRFMRHGRIAAFTGVIVFSWSNEYYFCTDNVQMIAFSILPVIMLCIGRWWEARHKRIRLTWAALGTGIFALQFYTAFYVGYFAVLYLCITAVILLVTLLVMRGSSKRIHFWKRLAGRLPEFCIYLLCFVILMIPFVWLYLPTLDSVGGRTWGEVSIFIPRIRNLIMRNPDAYDFFAPGESAETTNALTGFPLVEWIILGVSIICILIRSVRQRNEYPCRSIGWIVITITCVISTALAVNVHGYTLWYLIYRLVPGASGIRAVLRWYLILSLPMALIIAQAFDGAVQRGRIPGTVAALAGAAALFCLNYSPIGADHAWSVSSEEAFLNSVEEPPADCRVFYVVQSKNPDYSIEGQVQMDAWDIADRYGIRTIDGYSGQEPEGWDVHSYYEDVDEKAREWIAQNDVDWTGLYSYDIDTGVWTKQVIEAQ